MYLITGYRRHVEGSIPCMHVLCIGAYLTSKGYGIMVVFGSNESNSQSQAIAILGLYGLSANYIASITSRK